MTTGMLRVGSLFSGAGGLDLAVEQMFGGVTAWHCESDPAAARVLAHRWPKTPNLGDITAVDWAQAEPVDVLCGGWPCQPFSVAGRKAGITDERALWPEVERAVRGLRPGFIVLENVPTIFRAGEFDRVANSLAACGYDFTWTCLRASDAGAPHERRRVFIVAYPDGTRLERPHRIYQNGWSGVTRRDPLKLLATPQARDRRGEPKPGFCVSSLPRDVLEILDGYGAYEPAIRRWEALTRPAPYPAEPSSNGKPRVRAEFSEWMMGWPAGWVTAVPGITTREDLMRIIGNGVVPQHASAALRQLLAVACAA